MVTGDADGLERAQAGAIDRPFESEPTKIIALRKIRFTDTDRSVTGSSSHGEGWDIDDTFVSFNNLEISWQTRASSRFFEISYMIIGDVKSG